MASSRKFFLIAGEPSGDRLGASLMAGLKDQTPDVQFFGIGGPLMQAAGLTSIFPMGELSIMGLAEIVPKLPALLRRVRQAAKAVTDCNPDALITIDSPDFCLRVARKVKEARPQQLVIHYVAPTVWAWRPKRAVKMARHVDHVLALFPFEPPLMQAAGMSCDFVGHPVVTDPVPQTEEIEAFRAAYGIKATQKLIVVLPGSRLGEIGRMGPVFQGVMGRMLQADPSLRYIIPVTKNVEAGLLKGLSDWPGAPIILRQSGSTPELADKIKRVAFAASDLALAASGTVSLELAAVNTPMVIAYKFNWLTTQIIKRKVMIDTATLVNILTETRTVPEFLFEECTVETITPCMQSMLEDPAKATAQRDAAEKSMVLLGKGAMDPGLLAAASVLGVVV